MKAELIALLLGALASGGASLWSASELRQLGRDVAILRVAVCTDAPARCEAAAVALGR